MKKIIEEFMVYEFSELNESAKKKVKEWYLEDFSRNDIFYEAIKDDLNMMFPDSELDVQYSLNYCQGDGLNVYGHLSMEDMIPKLKGFTEKEIKRLRFYSRYIPDMEFEENRQYCYSYKYVDTEELLEEWLCWLTGLSGVNTDTIKKYIDYTVKYFRKLDKRYEEDGYAYLYEIDDAELDEMCNINEWLFKEDGTFYAA